MAKTARRHVSRTVGASCLAAAVTLSAGGIAAAAAPDVAQAAVSSPAEPTPPPPPEPPEPPPGNTTPEPPPGDSTPEPPPGDSTPEPPPGDTTPEPPGSDPDGSQPPESRTPEQKVQRLTAAEEKELQNELEKLKVPKELKERLKKTLDATMAAAKSPRTSAADKITYNKILKEITSALKVIQNAGTSASDKAALTRGVEGISEALRIVHDPKTSKADKKKHKELALAMSSIVPRVTDPALPVDVREFNKKVLLALSNAIIPDPTVGPTKPPDQKKIKQIRQQNLDALKTYADPDATQQQRSEAKAELEQLVEAPQNPEFLAFVEELKRLKAPQACLDSVQNRTSEAGWPEGSLWGVSDQSCAETVSAGAADTSSEWSGLFQCVQREPFSQCVGSIPRN
ncbi:hypothetical protein [Streptomyces atroolivaceus]|uniref:Secreted protein n=1 Tax=Streptomyces atroolivaceus TaxID=66869 RepID=A0ABV9VCR5_STRAZ|nr:hypothetical protein [Streptomyces atroolivaceus]